VRFSLHEPMQPKEATCHMPTHNHTNQAAKRLTANKNPGVFQKPCGNTNFTRTIPLPKTHIKRTESEIQLHDDTIEAEFREYCMFNRLVQGMHKRILKHGPRRPADFSSETLCAPIRAALLEQRGHLGIRRTTPLNAVMASSSSHPDDYGHFVNDENEASLECASSSTFFTFPVLPDAPEIHSSSPEPNSSSKKRVVSSSDSVAEEVEDSIFILEF